MKHLFILSLLCISLSSKAQYKFYSDSNYNQIFTLLTGATPLVPGIVWDDPDFSAPLGFMFHMFNDSSDMIYNSENFSLGSQLSLHPVPFGTDSVISAIIPLGSDFVDRGTGSATSISPISYRTDGIAPNRIFKMEWRNAGFYDAFSAGDTDDSLDLQLWLYEGSDIVESRIGTVNFVSAPLTLWLSNDGPFIGIADTLNFTSTGITAAKGYFLSGAITNPLLDSFVVFGGVSGVIPGMIGNPVSGMVFRFIPYKKPNGNVGYETLVSYAKPSFNYFQEAHLLEIELFENSIASYDIISMNGSIIQQGKINQGKNKLDVSKLSSGVFMVRLKQNNQFYNYKFAK